MTNSNQFDSSAETSTDPGKLERAFVQLRIDLQRLAQARLDQRLRNRIDVSDIIQNVYVTAQQRYEGYMRRPDIPLSGWLRFLTLQTVREAHRFHLGREKRSIIREYRIASDASVTDIVTKLADSLTTPHSAAVKKELQIAVREFMKSLSDIDQEILRLRHEDQLSNQQVAEVIGITESAASKRYIRALKRLRTTVEEYVK